MRFKSAALASILAISASSVFAQLNASPASTELSATSNMSGGLQATPAPTRIVAQGSVDPLVQKREADIAANKKFRHQKKMSKRAYKDQVKAASAERKAAKRDASLQERADMSAQGAAVSPPSTKQ